MINLKINDKIVRARNYWTILETARHYGIYIPTLCFHEAVKPNGACRLCTVEINNKGKIKLVASCIYKVSEDLIVLTNSERVKNVRKWILKMLFSEVSISSKIKVLANKNSISTADFKSKETKNKCILCELCTRVCKEVVGVSAISSVNRGIYKKISAPFFKNSKSCISCGSCITICPTGAMYDIFSSIN